MIYDNIILIDNLDRDKNIVFSKDIVFLSIKTESVVLSSTRPQGWYNPYII